MIMPASLFVAALNSLQKPMMFTPCWPKAGPTGGAGLACPAGICNLICTVTFFAIGFLSKSRITHHVLALLHLPILKFHRRIAAENIHRHLQFAALRLDFFNHAAEIEERTII